MSMIKSPIWESAQLAKVYAFLFASVAQKASRYHPKTNIHKNRKFAIYVEIFLITKPSKDVRIANAKKPFVRYAYWTAS